MQRENTNYLKNQLIELLQNRYQINNPEELLFKIEFDPTHQFNPQNLSEHFFFFRALPKIIADPLGVNAVVDVLTMEHNQIPLWIKINEIEAQKLYKLTCTKRFRKKHEIREWHKNNPFQPFL